MYGGMEISEAKRLRALERENTELKKMVTELSLDNQTALTVNAGTANPTPECYYGRSSESTTTVLVGQPVNSKFRSALHSS